MSLPKFFDIGCMHMMSLYVCLRLYISFYIHTYINWLWVFFILIKRTDIVVQRTLKGDLTFGVFLFTPLYYVSFSHDTTFWVTAIGFFTICNLTLPFKYFALHIQLRSSNCLLWDKIMNSLFFALITTPQIFVRTSFSMTDYVCVHGNH